MQTLRDAFGNVLTSPTVPSALCLENVILNLLRNACDAMASVNDRPRKLLIRTERDSEDGARLMVRDSGVGLDPRGIDRVGNGRQA